MSRSPIYIADRASPHAPPRRGVTGRALGTARRNRRGGAHRGQRGLTLVETLVAMAILAAVAISAFALLSQGANFAASERDRLTASIVADNLLIEELLKAAAPDLGERSGEVVFNGRTFEWSRVVTEAGDELRRIALTVRLKGLPQTLARVETVKAAS